MDIRYPATVESQKDGSFFVQFVDLPDTFTEGQTKEEALFNAAEVLSAMLAWRLDESKEVPAPSQKIRGAPRKLLTAIPGLKLREMQNSDLCCGSAGVYNVIHTDVAMQVLDTKMKYVKAVEAECIVTANPGCMLQLRYGAKKYETGQSVLHVVEVLDRAYGLSASQ